MTKLIEKLINEIDIGIDDPINSFETSMHPRCKCNLTYFSDNNEWIELGVFDSPSLIQDSEDVEDDNG